MLISLCMIVKNEERILERCLNSVKGLVDEIIIVDTGSTDRTKEIAAQHTKHVYDFKWINDFAAARNESLRYASGEWILVMDADEYAEPGKHEQLRKKLRSIRTNTPQCFLLKIINFHGDRGEQIYESTGARLFTNKKYVRYEEPIHEQLVCSNGTIQYSFESFTLFHTGYLSETVAEKGKNRRNLDILLGMESDSKLNDPYFCFVLGNEYVNAGSEEQAFVYYKKAMERASRDKSWYEHLMDRLCQSALRTDRLKDAEFYIRKGKELWPNAADYHCLEGMLYESLGFYNRALQSFKVCLAIAERCDAKREPYWITQESYGKSTPHKRSAEIAAKRGDLHQLVYHLTAILKLDHHNFTVLRQLLRTLSAHESADSIAAFIDKLYPLSNPKDAFILLQTSLLEGLRDLAFRTLEACHRHGTPISYADELSFRVLQKQEANREDGQKIAPWLALLASVVYGDYGYLEMIEPNATYERLSYRLRESEVEGYEAEPFGADEYAALTQLIVQFLRYGYLEEYERLVNQFADEELLHRLAEQLSSLGYMEIAIELYSVLLDNNLLRGEGYKQLGLYCLMNDNPQNGLQFMETAVQLSPSLDMLGLVLENNKGLDISGFMTRFSESDKLDMIPDGIMEEVKRAIL